MIGIRVSITRCRDDSTWPAVVECEFIDAHGQQHRFIEKSAIVTAAVIDSRSKYPQHGVIACAVVGRRFDDSDRELIVVNTLQPWSVESVDGLTTFEVLPQLLVEWEAGSDTERAWNGIA